VYGPDGTAVGKVSRIVESSNGDIGGVDVEVEFHAESDKIAAGVWAGVKCELAPNGGTIISLVDQAVHEAAHVVAHLAQRLHVRGDA
jgi:hypothetical protein